MVMLPYIQDLPTYFKLWPDGFTALVEKYRKCDQAGCNGHRIKWGSYRRWVITENHHEDILVQRLRCKECGKTVSLLPPFVLRYGRLCLDEVSRAIEVLATKGLSVFQWWRDILLLPMELKSCHRLLSVLGSLAEKAQARVQSWLSYLEPDFRRASVSDRNCVLPGRRHTLGQTIVMIKAFNEYRRTYGRETVSVMGLLHYLSEHCWTTLLGP